ncbi:MAG: ABC transporter permease [Caldilineales bacterium]|nr:ABC transporter permease [Caldilineales bacterium]
MPRFLLRRLLLIPLALAILHFAGFAYAHLAQAAQAARNPFGAAAQERASIWQVYGAYLQGAARGDLGVLPTIAKEPVGAAVLKASSASLGLLALAFLISAAIGVGLGFAAVRGRPPTLAGWLLPISALGLAAPSFFIGALAIGLLLALLLRGGPDAQLLIPLQGYGWDEHLILPLLALTIRPAAQIGQMVSGLLLEELHMPYVVAAASRGIPWRVIRWRHVLRNFLAPAILALAGSFRLIVGELVLVEWLFGWSGLGRLLAFTLLPPSSATVGGLSGHQPLFLHPPLVAALLMVLGLLFVVADTGAAVAARAVDPRLRKPELEQQHD